ncbi:MAG: hypothetical protein QOJ03_2390 [Frankiaceae bacterium]|nr:hypothetical protein [Frankiaceae bacterium]
MIDESAPSYAAPAPATPVMPPLYWRALRLRHVRPNGWQRALLVEGVLGVAVVLTLADIATAWTLLVLPLASMVIVKGHDLLAGALGKGAERDPGAEPALRSEPELGSEPDRRTAPPPEG